MILLPFLAAAAVAAASPTPEQPSFARAAVEAQLAQRAARRPRGGITGAEATAMRKTYLEQLAEKRDAKALQTFQTAPSGR
jgi:hypothetical protein